MPPPRLNDARFEDSPPNELPTRPEGHARPRPLVDPREWSIEPGYAEVWEDERPTPVRVVCPPLTASVPNPLAPLGRRKPTEPGIGPFHDPFPASEAPTPTVDNAEMWLVREGQRMLRNWRACPPDRRRQLSAMALMYRADAEGLDRKT